MRTGRRADGDEPVGDLSGPQSKVIYTKIRRSREIGIGEGIFHGFDRIIVVEKAKGGVHWLLPRAINYRQPGTNPGPSFQTTTTIKTIALPATTDCRGEKVNRLATRNAINFRFFFWA